MEKAGTTDSDKVIPVLKQTDTPGTAGRVVFDKCNDATFGSKFVTYMGTQWQDGHMICVWPNNWEGVTYEGTVAYKLSPWV